LWKLGLIGLGIAVAVVGNPDVAEAKNGSWSLRLEPIYMEVSGHDRTVLRIEELGQNPSSSEATLATDSGMAYRTQVQYTRKNKKWGFGVDLLWFKTNQSAPNPTAAANGPAGPVTELIYEVPDRRYRSTNPSEVLFYRVLEDTALATWTWDSYAIRHLSEKQNRTIDLQFGLRVADFDNDYRAAVGIEDTAGSRLDSSSNYTALVGPVVGINGDFRRGKHTFEGYLGQSVVFGDVELDARTRDYVGPFTENPDPPFVDDDRFQSNESVNVPITDLRLKWSYRLTKRWSLGAGINSSTWWSLPVPPGVEIGGEGASQARHESDLTFWGFTGIIQVDL
jgi:hypothetical protein